MTLASLRAALDATAHRHELALELAVYAPLVLDGLLGAVQGYLTAEAPAPARRWLPWPRAAPAPPRRVNPVLLAGPAGTGKTTLMMLLDRTLTAQSILPLLRAPLHAHPSANGHGPPPPIELHPLALMGRTHNIPTGVLRLSELQRFYRRATYDQQRSRTDMQAADDFAALFAERILYVDEFVPDVVSSFPMQVINHLADHGVLMVLSSNRHETPFVKGVTVIPVVGDDLRHGSLAPVARPASADPRFDDFRGMATARIGQGQRGIEVRQRRVSGERWRYVAFASLAHASIGWHSLHALLEGADRLLIDEVPVFDPAQEVGPDVARRFVFLVDALYDQRVPVLLRLTNPQPLREDIDIDRDLPHYRPETRLDLERAVSRLRQLGGISVSE